MTTSLGAPHHQRQFECPLGEGAVDLIGFLAEPSFVRDSELVRLHREKITFLGHECDRHVVRFLADNHELESSAVRAVIRKLHRDVTRVTHELVFTLPLAFEVPADCGVSRWHFHLRRAGFFQNERRAVSALAKIAGKMAVRGEMGMDLRLPGSLVTESTHYRESE